MRPLPSSFLVLKNLMVEWETIDTFALNLTMGGVSRDLIDFFELFTEELNEKVEPNVMKLFKREITDILNAFKQWNDTEADFIKLGTACQKKATSLVKGNTREKEVAKMLHLISILMSSCREARQKISDTIPKKKN